MPIDPEFLGLVRHEPDIVLLKPGETLFAEGEVGDCFYVVRSGTVRLASGNTVYEDVEAGGILGEMALLETAQRSATATATSDCDVARIDKRRFLFLVQQTPHFSLKVMHVLSRRLREMNRRYRY